MGCGQNDRMLDDGDALDAEILVDIVWSEFSVDPGCLFLNSCFII